MREKNKHSVCGGTLLLVLRMSRAAGVAPISFGPHGLNVSKPMYIYSLIFIFVMNVIILTGFLLDISEPHKSLRANTLTETVCWVSNLCVVTALALVGCVGAPKRCACFIDVLSGIHKIRNHFGYAEEKSAERSFYLIIFWLFVICLGILSLTDIAFYTYSALQVNKELYKLYLFSFFYIEYYIEILLGFQFLLIMFHVRLGLADLNCKLKDLLQALDKQNNKDRSVIVDNFMSPRAKPFNYMIPLHVECEPDIFRVEASRTIRVLIFAYESICELLRKLEQSHGTVLLVLLQSFFLHSIITPYNLITIYAETGSIWFAAIQVGWFSLHACNVVLIVEPCHRMQVEVPMQCVVGCSHIEMDTTRELVSRLVRRADAALAGGLRVFYRVLALNRPAVAPLGLCVLGRPLVVSMLGAVTTYLVIILQFKASDELL
ncbi:uncharacterized protein LOC123700379 [Colias croceus]|uniref:uncharacterized protein LOC123700379 n=1 Tax=Colias crocea TaxID=72248 RepID=UPI001E27E306|nr:uncharacterized protein LOC123700379 [Colias croceus]